MRSFCGISDVGDTSDTSDTRDTNDKSDASNANDNPLNPSLQLWGLNHYWHFTSSNAQLAFLSRARKKQVSVNSLRV